MRRELKEALGEILELAGAARVRRLEALARDDPALRAELEPWLALEDEARGFLDAPAATNTSSPTLGPGDRVGSFVVRGILGVGGSSVVYEAEQEHPRRPVALKVLLSGPESPGALQRFLGEAQVLAELQHPAIAQVFEAGTQEGDRARAYFALELVPGARPLTRYVEEERLDRRARLSLLVTVCDAVAHGHQHGVIHRDLKPANVLVDDAGRPRVIDFGIAKLVGRDAHATAPTLPGTFLGTLAYMSPEQAAGDPRRVDTRSDVYALGVLAYEVLCGRPPHDLEGAPLVAALGRIQHAAPERPGLSPDLDAVLLKALEKERERRYPSASELGADLGRALAGEPVSARPPTLGSYARMYLRRHRFGVTTALVGTLAAIALVVGLSLRTARLEARERAKAEQVKDFLLSVLALTEPSELDLRDLLDRAATRIDDELSGVPDAALEVHATVGQAYRKIGALEEAEHHLRRAVELAAGFGGARPWLAAAGTRNALADLLLEAGRPAEAEATLAESLAILARQDPGGLAETIALRKLAEALRQNRSLERAEETARDALERYRAALGPDHDAEARARETLGRILLDEGRPDEACAELEGAQRIDLANHGESSLEVARTRLFLGEAQLGAGNVDAAREALEAARKGLAGLLDADHPSRRRVEELLRSIRDE